MDNSWHFVGKYTLGCNGIALWSQSLHNYLLNYCIRMGFYIGWPRIQSGKNRAPAVCWFTDKPW